MYELFIEGRRADIDQKISILTSFCIDDIKDFSSRNTAFSKTIVLPGTSVNNDIFGHIYELGSYNEYIIGANNIGNNYNVAQTSEVELRYNGLLILKGVFRLLSIIKTGNTLEYEGAIFGELGGFIAAIGNSKLEDLDFSAYDHAYTFSNITGSWDTIDGNGYYYPLIDYGTYSTDKDNYQYKTFRPAFFVKEIIEKIFTASGYDYDFPLLNTSLFDKLIIPNNQKFLSKYSGLAFDVKNTNYSDSGTGLVRDIPLPTQPVLGNFTANVLNTIFTYSSGTNLTGNISLKIKGNVNADYTPSEITIQKNSSAIYTEQLDGDFDLNVVVNNITFTNNDTLRVRFLFQDVSPDVNNWTLDIENIEVKITTDINTVVPINLTETITMNDIIPRNIFQKDFIMWIVKMFNLYIYEDVANKKKLIIKPYIDFYDLSTYIDWTYKLARDQTINIMPMSLLNGRFIECKYKPDNDYYNEGYQKKYNVTYGDRLFDTGYQFAKDKETIEIGFSPTVLVQTTGTDKIVPTIFKRNATTEDTTESNIRILLAKKVTGVDSWQIRDGATSLGNLTSYGYAGHFDDPINPTIDINFGAANEIFFTPTSYTSNNLFNTYWSGYIAEIADKDSKLLKAHVYLTPLDIAQLDFSIPVFIDGVTWRINKVEDYDATNNELVKVELLKIINNG